MALFLTLAFILQAHPVARAASGEAGVSVAPTSPTTGKADAGADDGEYEVDYEEEADADAGGGEEEAPEPVKGRKKEGAKARNKTANGPAVQGSRAKNRFVPLLKSDTRSVYLNKGRAYDVDTD